MEQKVNPHGLRIGLGIGAEDPRWYDEDHTEYLDFIVEKEVSNELCKKLLRG